MAELEVKRSQTAAVGIPTTASTMNWAAEESDEEESVEQVEESEDEDDDSPLNIIKI